VPILFQHVVAASSSPLVLSYQKNHYALTREVAFDGDGDAVVVAVAVVADDDAKEQVPMVDD